MPLAAVAVIVDVCPIHMVVGLALTVTVGFAFIVIVIDERGPSQLGDAVSFCDTYHVVVPAVVVGGVGAVVLAVPPVDTVYHCNVYPDNAVACNAVDVAPTQYSVVCAGITGAAGVALTVTVVLTDGEVHPDTVEVTL